MLLQICRGFKLSFYDQSLIMRGKKIRSFEHKGIKVYIHNEVHILPHDRSLIFAIHRCNENRPSLFFGLHIMNLTINRSVKNSVMSEPISTTSFLKKTCKCNGDFMQYIHTANTTQKHHPRGIMKGRSIVKICYLKDVLP